MLPAAKPDFGDLLALPIHRIQLDYGIPVQNPHLAPGRQNFNNQFF